MRIPINIFLALILTLVTINSATAYDTETMGVASDSEWRKMDSDLALTWGNNDYVYYLDSVGFLQSTDATIYGARELVEDCVQPYNNEDNCLVVCNSGTDICELNFLSDSFTVIENIPAPSQDPTLKLFARIPDAYIMTTNVGATFSWFILADNMSDVTSQWNMPIFKPSFNLQEVGQYVSPPPITTYDADWGYVMWDNYYDKTFDTLSVDAYYQNASKSITFTNVYDRTGDCYNYQNHAESNSFTDANFPSQLFATWDSQSDTILLKPDCHYYLIYDVSDLDDVVGTEYPTNYIRGGLAEPPLMYQPSGVWESGRLTDPLFYNAQEMFLEDDEHINLYNSFYNYNDGDEFTPYMGGFGDYTIGYGEANYRTMALGNAIIYPSSATTFDLATNLGESLDVEIIGEQEWTYDSDDLVSFAYFDADTTYVMNADFGGATVYQLNTSDNSNMETISDRFFASPIGAPYRIQAFGGTYNKMIVYAKNTYQITELTDEGFDGSYTIVNHTTTGLQGGISDSDIGDLTTWYNVNTNNNLNGSGYFQSLCKSSGVNPYAGTCTVVSPIGSQLISQIELADSVYNQNNWLLGMFKDQLGFPSYGWGMCKMGVTPACNFNIPYETLLGMSGGVDSQILKTDGSSRAISPYNGSHYQMFTYTKTLSGDPISDKVFCKNPIFEYSDYDSWISDGFEIITTTKELGIASTENGLILICDPDITDPNYNTVARSIGAISNDQDKITQISEESDGYLHVGAENHYAIIDITGWSLSDSCGDDVCGVGETSQSCPLDCVDTCGDGYCTGAETYLSCPLDCPSGNETIINETIVLPDPINVSDPIDPVWTITMAKLIDDYTALIGYSSTSEDPQIALYNISNYDFVEIEQEELKDFAYDIDFSGDNAFLGTDNEVHVLSGVTSNDLTLDYTDGWLLLFDRVKSIVAINSTNAFVCQDNNKFYYYTLGSDPTGGTGNGCYDLEYDSTKKVLYVQTGIDGIVSYNVTDPNSPSMLDEIDNQEIDLYYEYGDLMEIRGDYLLAQTNVYEMYVYNISDPSSMTTVNSCNNLANGVIRSVEWYSDNLVVGGTFDSRLSICNLSNSNPMNNTATYYLEDFDTSPIVTIEQGSDGLLRIFTEKQLGYYNITIGYTVDNTPPQIASYTVSDTSPFINQPVVVSINETGVEPEDVIHFGYDCEGDGNWIDLTNPDYTCFYNTSGNFNLRIGVTDNFHSGTWYDQTIIPITVQPIIFEGGILNINVLSESQEAIENAQVTLDNETKLTNTLGFVTFETEDTGLYEVSTQKSGYYNSVDNFYADGLQNAVYLVLVPTGNETTLEVTVIDNNGAFVESALVSYTNTISYEFDYKWTNALGFVVFTDVSSGSLALTVSKDGHETSQTTIYASNGIITSTTVILDGGVDGVFHEERDCIDNGIWLCGEDIGQSCTLDSECLSDDCTVSGICGRFNMSVCDENDYPRGQKCVYKYTFESWMGGLTDWLLGNLLWVIILMILIIGFGIMGFALKK